LEMAVRTFNGIAATEYDAEELAYTP
jgi:hypothetical protein